MQAWPRQRGVLQEGHRVTLVRSPTTRHCCGFHSVGVGGGRYWQRTWEGPMSKPRAHWVVEEEELEEEEDAC